MTQNILIKIFAGFVFITLPLLLLFGGVSSAYSASVPDTNSRMAALNFEGACEVGPGEDLSTDNCGIIAYLVVGINILSAIAGMAIVASIMIAGFQYMTARDNSGQIEAARKRIVWAITALVLFIFMYAFLNFIVPGGVL
jgi:hypothetical protein